MADIEPTPELITISPDRYISREYLEQEKAKVFPNVWQVACREEEIKEPGEFVTYNIGDDSIIVARTKAGEIIAYHNVCPHRGRRLTKGCGKASQFRCGFHNWTFDLEGKNVLVQDKHDWNGALDGVNIDLQRVRVDTWGGFVFIDMRAEGESLTEYLEQIPGLLQAFEYEKLRFRWYKTLHLDCNWKVALEAFVEGYHLAATHPQLLPIIGDDYTQSHALGKHSRFGYWESKTPLGMPAPRLNQPWPKDPRPNVIRFFQIYNETLKAMFSERDCEAAFNLMDVLGEDTDPATAFVTAVELGRKAAEAEGIGYPPELTWEIIGTVGNDFHIFPNFITLPWFDGALCYRGRPHPDNPDKCIFDIWSLVRYAPGKEPPLERIEITDMTGQSAGQIVDQDISNMGEVQKGMKSRAFKRGIANPVQEVPVVNFHKQLDDYIAR